jgi:hypothetical protein
MIELDERDVRERLRPLTDDGRLRDAIANISADPLLLSLFLMGMSHAEGLAEAGVTAIGDDDIARLVRGPRSGRSAAMRLIVEDLFPECFDHGQYRYDDHVFGRDHHLTVRDANRRRLRERGRYSPLNLHLTTSFAHDVATALLGAAVVDALGRSPLPAPIPERVAALLGRTGTDGGWIARHNALLATDRQSLSPTAVEAIEALGRLTAGDYASAAELAVRELVAAYVPYADPTALRARIAGR